MNRTRFLLLIVLVLMLVPSVAFAQSIVPVAALTPYSVLVTVLTLVLGALTTAKNTSSFLGKPIAANVMVWLMMVLPFVAGVTTTFVQAGSLTSVSAFNAIVAGLVAVTAGATPGLVVHAALHAHLNVPKVAEAMRANAGKAAAVAMLVLGLGLVSTQSACKGASSPQNIVMLVIADFEQGKSPAQIDADVCAAIGGTSLEDVICKDVSTTVIDIIDSLIAKGQLSPAAQTRAQSYKATHTPAASK